MPVVIRAGLIVLGAMLMTSIALGQTPEVSEVEKRCSKAEETAELKECLKTYQDINRKLEEEYSSYINMVTECLAKKTSREVSSCVTDGVLAALSPKDSPPATKPAAAASEPPARPAPSKPEWLVKQETSRMDGSPSVFMTMLAEEPIATGYGSRTFPSMHIRCMERVTSLFIAADWFLGSRPAPIMFRIDQEKPVQQSWIASTDSKAVGLWNGAVAIPFLKSLMGKEALLVRVTPYNESPKETAFPLSDLAKAIEPLRKACGW